MSTLVAGIATRLDAQGAGAYSPDDVLPADRTPISVAGFPSTVGDAICLTTYPGGPEPDSRNGWEYPRLQVRVRSTDPLDALELDRRCYGELQGLSNVTLAGGWFVQDCYALQSEAEPLGRDDNGRWEFARNYQLSTEPPG